MLLRVAGGLVTLGVGLWVGVHYIPWLGPAIADGTRAVVGPAPIAWLEDTMYGLDDELNQLRFAGDKPKTFWETPPDASAVVAASPSAAASSPNAGAGEAAPGAAPRLPAFVPPEATVPYKTVLTDDDAKWVPIPSESGDIAMYKTVIHPDARRGWAATAVVAMDLRRLRLSLVAGTREPEAEHIPRSERPGMIPAAEAPDVVAAFNGGFKAMHGHYGMKVGAQTFLPAREMGCTIALYNDNTVRIRSWPEIKATEPDMVAYRQTPKCLIEQGVSNPALELEQNRHWGSTVSGETVIRRSAVGLDRTGNVLYYALGEHMTAKALAKAMESVGAHDAAQLDVNFSYPRFLLYGKPPGEQEVRATGGLIGDIEYAPEDYIAKRSQRDFFYLTTLAPSP